MSTLACPICRAEIVGYASVTVAGARPRPGDFSICSYCMTPLEFIASPDGPPGALQLGVLDQSRLSYRGRRDLNRTRAVAERMRLARRALDN